MVWLLADNLEFMTSSFSFIHLICQKELNNLVRDLDWSKNQTELLNQDCDDCACCCRVKNIFWVKKIFAAVVNIRHIWGRKLFTQVDSLIFCGDIDGSLSVFLQFNRMATVYQLFIVMPWGCRAVNIYCMCSMESSHFNGVLQSARRVAWTAFKQRRLHRGVRGPVPPLPHWMPGPPIAPIH